MHRFVAQSALFYRYARQGGPVKTEADPLDETPPPSTGKSLAAISYLEKATIAFGGIALRYGGFYGAANDAAIEPVRKRQFPIVGDGGGIFSWMHLDDGAAATLSALEQTGPAIYNIADDDPAPVREWLPAFAQWLKAPPPPHISIEDALKGSGADAVYYGTQMRGASNAKAKRELNFQPRPLEWIGDHGGTD